MPAHDPITSLAPGQPLLDPLGNDWSWAYVIHREIPGFLGYAAGSDGSVWSLKIGDAWRRLKPATGLLGRQTVILAIPFGRAARMVHRIVLETFIGPCPPGMECCHGNGHAGDNRLDNLRWDTRLANMADAIRHGTMPRGSTQGSSKLTEARILEAKALVKGGMTQDAVAARFGVAQSTIQRAIRGKTWTHVRLRG